MKRISILLYILIPAFLFSQEGRFTPELLWQLGRVADPQVSPDGKWILYGVKWYDIGENGGQMDLFITSVSGDSSWRLTQTPYSESGYLWRPDGKKVGYLSNESGSWQWYESDVDGSGKKQVTHAVSGIGNFKYSPGMKYVSFTKNVKLDQDVHDMYPGLPKADAKIFDGLMYRHWDEWHDYQYSHVFRALYSDGEITGESFDLMDGERFDSPLNPFGGSEQITWSPDESTIIYVSKKLTGKDYAESTNSELYMYDVRSKRTLNISKPNKGYDMDPVYSPDGTKLVWLSMQRDGFEADKNRIMLYDLNTNIRTDLTAEFDQSASHLRWSANGEYLYFISGINATYHIFELELKSGKIRQVTTGDYNYNSFEIAGDVLVAHRNSMLEPAELFTVQLKKGEAKQLTHVNDEKLKGIKSARIEKHFVKSTDGKEVLSWVILPPDFDPSRQYPALLYCQGGPQSAVSQFFSYRWNFQVMAARDYVIIAPNRRGLPTFGQEWNDQISGEWGGQAIQDQMAAAEHVSLLPYVNPDRLGAVGASYGGYSVYQLAGIHKKKFKAFVSHCGIFNLESWYSTTEELFFANWDIRGPWWGQRRPKSYDQFSPHKYVQNWDTPILVIHGAEDYRVPVQEGIQAFNSAQMLGVKSRFLYFPEEGHWVMSPQNGILWHRVFFDWLDEHLKYQ